MGFKGGRFSGLSRSKTGSGKLQSGIKGAVPLLCFFALTACAIAPVQQNVTGLPVVRIVNHIHCETRIAIQKKALDESCSA
jgi:hypothetical protein